ncbi:MAG: histidinol-phosphate transaminase [archaeon]|nr:histidinol-phosphate transaminase [archaeon]
MIKPKLSVQKMEKYNPPLEGRRGKLRLDFNENTHGCSLKVIEALKKINAEEVSSYPEYKKFRKRLADYINIDVSEILLTNGADEAIKVVMDTFIEKEDEIIISTPTFSMFKVYASIACARINSILYNKDLSFPTKKVIDKINSSTELVILVNPNNPTGTVINENDIVKILKKAENKNTLILIDEAYYQYYSKSAKELIKKYENLIVIHTFSKAFGLAGLRLGYIISNTEIIRNLEKVISPYSVNSLALVAGSAAINDTKFVNNYVSKVKRNKQYIVKELNRLGIKTYPTQANFLVANFGEKSDIVYKKLKQKNILIRNVTKYPLLSDCLRITVGTKEQCSRLIKEIRYILRKKVLLFDMDGVLVDVSNSYRLAIKKTSEFFTKEEIKEEEIQRFKEKGGYNNDWDLAEAIILEKNIKIPKPEIIQKFQELLKGLMNNEKWLLSKKVLSELYKSYRLGIVTGRPGEEAYYALNKAKVLKYFDVIITSKDYPEEKAKPDPFSINLALKQLGDDGAVYLGDTIDDMKAAKNAGIRAIGVLPPNTSGNKLRELLKQNSAKLVLKDINDITKLLK